MFTKRDLQFPKPLKSEKYETFCVSKLPISRQTLVACVRHGNSVVVRRVSPGEVKVVLL